MATSEFNRGELYDYGETNGSSLNPFSSPATTADLIKTTASQILNGNFNNSTLPLSDWQKDQLSNVRESGVRCLLDMWLNKQTELVEGSYCNATWDNVYCWPPTPVGSVVSRPCSEILQETDPVLAHHIQGNANRVCLENGTWLWGSWTNYSECADLYEKYVSNTEEERKLVVTVQYIIFVGSLLSLISLALALTIFYYFKCLWCDRVTVHIHLMMALMLRSASLIIITEPFIFNRTTHYRQVDVICKAVLSTNLYATVASVNWMFIQGVYLHGKLTTNVFDKGTPFRIYYVTGWIFPLFLVTIYAIVLETYHPVHCWRDYSERSEIWILLGPIIFALLANLIFLINIMHILLTKVQRPNSSSDSMQLRRAVKATLILFPLLGINNLLFLHNPGGDYHKYFVSFNAVFGSTQGIFVSILYCFVSKDVRAAICRVYQRFVIRRSTNASSRVSYSSGCSLLRHFTITSRPMIHLRTKLRNETQVPEEVTRARITCSTSPELVIIHEVKNKDSTSDSSFADGNKNRNSHDNQHVLQEKVKKEKEQLL